MLEQLGPDSVAKCHLGFVGRWGVGRGVWCFAFYSSFVLFLVLSTLFHFFVSMICWFVLFATVRQR